jgi:DNA-binding PadR family transcriptional regulator
MNRTDKKLGDLLKRHLKPVAPTAEELDDAFDRGIRRFKDSLAAMEQAKVPSRFQANCAVMEGMVLSALRLLGPGEHATPEILTNVRQRMREHVNVGHLYVALDSLIERWLVQRERVEELPDGRRLVYYSITAEGVRAHALYAPTERAIIERDPVADFEVI